MTRILKYRQAGFVKSATQRGEWPGTERPELALCGRSNVGKSTLLNDLLGQKGLARVSRTPGRTRLINFFDVELIGSPELSGIRVADLPGFGYAQVSKSERQGWQQMIEEYLTVRASLRAVVLLCDSRRAADADAEELLAEEVALARFLRQEGRKVVLVMTKADKLSKHERKPALLALGRLFAAKAVAFSGLSGEGREELAAAILRALRPTELATSDELAEGRA